MSSLINLGLNHIDKKENNIDTPMHTFMYMYINLTLIDLKCQCDYITFIVTLELLNFFYSCNKIFLNLQSFDVGDISARLFSNIAPVQKHFWRLKLKFKFIFVQVKVKIKTYLNSDTVQVGGCHWWSSHLRWNIWASETSRNVAQLLPSWHTERPAGWYSVSGYDRLTHISLKDCNLSESNS